MRAVVLRGGHLGVRETDDPVPGPGRLLLRVVSTATCASDVHFRDHHDAVPDAGNAGMVCDEDRDIVLGHAFVGDVVDAFAVGEYYVRACGGYGALDAICEGRLDPPPCVGKVIGLDGVPDVLEAARRSEGPPRVVVHP